VVYLQRQYFDFKPKPFLTHPLQPDLPKRIELGADLTPFDPKTFYKPESPVGYIDYPFLEETQPQSKL